MGNKREHFINGHQFRLDGYWYNFCVKCGYVAGNKNSFLLRKCSVSGNREDLPKNSHNYSETSCKKCEEHVSANIFSISDGKVLIYFFEQTVDRITERFACTKFHPKSSGFIEIYCKYSDEDVLMRNIII